MGLTVREMLSTNTFEGFRLMAGKDGLDNQIQGVAILDAPDGFNWTRGREFVISSGYLLGQDKDLIHRYIESERFKKISCMGIKTRYIKGFSQDVINKFNEFKVPLIIIPQELSWMDLINNLNVLVMNKNIKQFNIGSINPRNISNLSYQGRKIHKILSKMEDELNFPAMLYDIDNDRTYYSSNSFIKLSEHTKEDDFWNPSFEHTRQTLCDNLNMIRYRFTDEKRFERPFSWITIPVKIGGLIKAYFVLVEKTELIDYFDQFSIRIGFLLLQSLYEQMMAVREIEDRGFEKFILDIISGYLMKDNDISKRAAELDINERDMYFMLLIKQENQGISLSDARGELRKAMSSYFDIEGFRAGIIDRDSLLILIPVNTPREERCFLDSIDGEIARLSERLELKIPSSSYIFGISDSPENIYGIKRNYSRCQQAIRMGKLLFPHKTKINYGDLGPFAWMNVQEDELEDAKKKFDELLSSGDNEDLIQTLKIYLRNNMNYSQTAKSIYVHINTVRKRIEQAVDIMDFDLENPIERLNLEILLELLY